jgi:hypothetical protein
MSDGGKGSSPRPFSVSQDTFASNYDRIFRKSPKEIDDDIAEKEEFEYLSSLQSFKANTEERDEPNRNTSNF